MWESLETTEECGITTDGIVNNAIMYVTNNVDITNTNYITYEAVPSLDSDGLSPYNRASPSAYPHGCVVSEQGGKWNGFFLEHGEALDSQNFVGACDTPYMCVCKRKVYSETRCSPCGNKCGR